MYRKVSENSSRKCRMPSSTPTPGFCDWHVWWLISCQFDWLERTSRRLRQQPLASLWEHFWRRLDHEGPDQIRSLTSWWIQNLSRHLKGYGTVESEAWLGEKGHWDISLKDAKRPWPSLISLSFLATMNWGLCHIMCYLIFGPKPQIQPAPCPNPWSRHPSLKLLFIGVCQDSKEI